MEYRIVSSTELEVHAGVHAERLNRLAADGFELIDTVASSKFVMTTMCRALSKNDEKGCVPIAA